MLAIKSIVFLLALMSTYLLLQTFIKNVIAYKFTMENGSDTTFDRVKDAEFAAAWKVFIPCILWMLFYILVNL